MMNEGAIFAKLFDTCDKEQRGRVRVSKIIQYLHQTTQPADTSATNLQHLRTLLDPQGLDPEINYETYEQGISTWVQTLRLERSSPDRDVGGVRTSRYSPEQLRDEFGGHSFVLSGDSIEGYGGDMSSRNLDQSELMTTVDELRSQIQKLSKEKEELLRQLDLAEESNAQLNTAVAEHKRQLKNCQTELGRVKQVMSDLQSSRDFESKKVAQLAERNEALEQTRVSLEVSIADSKEQLSQRVHDLEHMEETNKALAEKLDGLQARMSGEGEGGSFFLDHSLGSTEELLRLIDELRAEKEAAVKDREGVEQSLLQARQENDRLRSALDGNRPVSAIAPASPVSASTPFKAKSLQHEMTGDAEETTDGYPGSHDSLKENDGSLDTSDNSLSSSSFDHFSLVASQAHAQFRQKHELALKQITELTALDPGRYTREESVRTELEEDEMSFKNKLSHLIASKQHAEKKLKKLHSALSRCRAERQELIKERNDAVERLEGYVKDTETRSREIADLKGKLVGEQFKNGNLQRELNDTKREIDQLRDENQSLSISAEEWGQQRVTLEQHLRELQSSLQNVEDMRGSVDADQVVSLRDDNETLRRKSVCDKSRITELEDALELSGQSHGKELQELWKILVESGRDHMAPPQDLTNPNQTLTGYRVKELLIQQLQQLRSEVSRQGSLILDMSASPPEVSEAAAVGEEESRNVLTFDDSGEDTDTGVDTWGVPRGRTSSESPDTSLSALARQFDSVLSQFLSEKGTLRQRIEQQRQAYESTEADFRKELGDIAQTIADYQPCAITKEERALCSKLKRQCDVLTSIVSRLARKASAHSALKQEERLAHRFEVVFRYVKCLQGEVSKVSEELWSGQSVMVGRSGRTSEVCGPTDLGSSGGQDLVVAKLERLMRDVQQCEKDINALDKRTDALRALPRPGVGNPNIDDQKSLWSWCKPLFAFLILIGLLLFLALELVEHPLLACYGASWCNVPFWSYHHHGAPPT